MTAQEFRELFDAVSNWGRWDDDGRRGALNHLTPARIAAAARLVRSGETVTLSQPLKTEARLDVPEPADHHMTMLTDVDIGSGSVRFAKDYVGVDYHNDGHSHIDAFSHVAFEGSFFDGKPDRSVTIAGCAGGRQSTSSRTDWSAGPFCSTCRECVMSRGSSRANTSSARTSRQRSANKACGWGPATSFSSAPGIRGAWPSSSLGTPRKAKSGLHPTTASFLADRRVAALGSDGNNDTAPSTTEGVAFPIHVLALNAMGVHLLDYLQFEDVAPHCEATGRWEFLFVAAPLRIVRGTGSPLNPIAIF